MKKVVKSLVPLVKYLKWIPNALTLGNSLCGFAAILFTLLVYDRGNASSSSSIFAFSAFMILCAMVFDAFDGYAARLLNAASLHGIQMDSLADMVTFGVAPATLVAVMAHKLLGVRSKEFLLIWCLSAIYLGCAALRLAKYNVHAMQEKKSSDKFSGIPSPGAAAAICSLIFLFAVEHSDKPSMLKLITVLPWYAAILGFLMVSTIPYQHFGKWFFSALHNKRRLAVLILIIASLAAESILRKTYPVWVIAVLINGYVIWGLIAFCLVRVGLLKRVEDAHL